MIAQMSMPNSSRSSNLPATMPSPAPATAAIISFIHPVESSPGPQHLLALGIKEGHRISGGLSLRGGKQPRRALQDAAHNPTTGSRWASLIEVKKRLARR